MVIMLSGSENEGFHYKYQVIKHIKNSNHQYFISFLRWENQSEFVNSTVCRNFQRKPRKYKTYINPLSKVNIATT